MYIDYLGAQPLVNCKYKIALAWCKYLGQSRLCCWSVLFAVCVDSISDFCHYNMIAGNSSTADVMGDIKVAWLHEHDCSTDIVSFRMYFTPKIACFWFLFMVLLL